MLKFNKVFNSKIISLIVGCIFLFTNTAYGVDLSEKTHLRKTLDFNDSNATPQYLCVSLAVTYHNSILKQNLTPEKALERVMEEVDKRNAKDLKIRIAKDSNGIWIYHEPDNIYIRVYHNGQFGPESKEEFKEAIKKQVLSRRDFLKIGVKAGGVLALGGVTELIADDKIEKRCLEDKKVLKEKIDSLCKKHGLDYYELNKIFQNNEIFEIIKDYLKNNINNEYSLLVVFDVLGLIKADYKNGRYSPLDQNIGRKIVLEEKGGYTDFATYLLVKFLSSEVIKKTDKIEYLWQVEAPWYFVSQSSYGETIKAFIYTGDRNLQDAAIGHMALNLSDLSLEILKDVVMDVSNDVINDFVIRSIVKKLKHLHLKGIKDESLFVGTYALEFGALNLGALSSDSAILMIKALRKIKALSLLDNKWAKNLYDLVLSSLYGIVVVTDVDNRRDFKLDWRKNSGLLSEVIYMSKDERSKLAKKIGREGVNRYNYLAISLKNMLKNPLGRDREDIIVDHIFSLMSHELDHIRTGTLDGDRDVYSTDLLKFINEKHAYLVEFDITQNLAKEYLDPQSLKHRKKLVLTRYALKFILTGGDPTLALPDLYDHQRPSKKYKGLSKLEEYIIKRNKLKADSILKGLRESDKGGGIYSGRDLEFQYNDWVYKERKRKEMVKILPLALLSKDRQLGPKGKEEFTTVTQDNIKRVMHERTTSSEIGLVPKFFDGRDLLRRDNKKALEGFDEKIRKIQPDEVAVILVKTSDNKEKELKTYFEKFGDKVEVLNLNRLKSDMGLYNYFNNIIVNTNYRDAIRGDGLRLEDAKKHLDKV